MKKSFLKTLVLFSTVVLGVDGIVYFGVSPKGFQASVLEEQSITVETQEVNLGVPNLVPAINTLVNRNGATVFYGYKSGEIDSDELLRLSYERRTQNNRSKGIGIPRQRTNNYRPAHYNSQAKKGESIHTSAPAQSTGVRRATLEETRTLGFQNQVQEKSSKKTRVSLVHSMRAYGTANTVKNARAKVEARHEWNGKVWAQNRTQDNDPLLKKDRSKIQINVKDSRKNILEYYKEMEEFYAAPSVQPTEEATPSE